MTEEFEKVEEELTKKTTMFIAGWKAALDYDWGVRSHEPIKEFSQEARELLSDAAADFFVLTPAEQMDVVNKYLEKLESE